MSYISKGVKATTLILTSFFFFYGSTKTTLITLMPAGTEKASLFSRRATFSRERKKAWHVCQGLIGSRSLILWREKAFPRCQEMESEASIEVLHANVVSWASVAAGKQKSITNCTFSHLNKKSRSCTTQRTERSFQPAVTTTGDF